MLARAKKQKKAPKERICRFADVRRVPAARPHLPEILTLDSLVVAVRADAKGRHRQGGGADQGEGQE